MQEEPGIVPVESVVAVDKLDTFAVELAVLPLEETEWHGSAEGRSDVERVLHRPGRAWIVQVSHGDGEDRVAYDDRRISGGEGAEDTELLESFKGFAARLEVAGGEGSSFSVVGDGERQRFIPDVRDGFSRERYAQPFPLILD